MPLHLRHKIRFHSQKSNFIHTSLRHWFDNDVVRFVNLKSWWLKLGSVRTRKKIKIFISDTFFGALFLSLRVGNYMWKLCHLINKAFFFTLHILLYRIPTKLERYERWKCVYFLKRVCNRPLKTVFNETLFVHRL